MTQLPPPCHRHSSPLTPHPSPLTLHRFSPPRPPPYPPLSLPKFSPILRIWQVPTRPISWRGFPPNSPRRYRHLLNLRVPYNDFILTYNDVVIKYFMSVKHALTLYLFVYIQKFVIKNAYIQFNQATFGISSLVFCSTFSCSSVTSLSASF